MKFVLLDLAYNPLAAAVVVAVAAEEVVVLY